MKDTYDRIGILAFTDWKTDGGWHPRTFYPGDAMQTIYTMRTRSGPAGCAIGYTAQFSSKLLSENVLRYLIALPR